MITTIAFDADDTLWDNEIYFRQSESRFCRLLNGYADESEIMAILYDVEIKNIPLYGYGIKSFVISMIDTIGIITKGTAPYSIIEQAIAIGREQISAEVTVLPDVVETLKYLSNSEKYRLILATKGDLLDQKRKLQLSGLESYFDNVEIMCDKQSDDYTGLCNRLQCSPTSLIMIGNSFKSDILPVVELGGYGIYIPYKTTWQHEITPIIRHERIYQISRLQESIDIINKLK